MDKKYQKYVNALFILGGALVWFVSRHYVETLIGRLQIGRRLGGGLTDVLLHGLPILLGVITFIILRRNRKSESFVSESVDELVRVTWPSGREVQFGTIVVIITVVLAGIILGGIDIGLNAFVRTLLGA